MDGGRRHPQAEAAGREGQDLVAGDAARHHRQRPQPGRPRVGGQFT